LANHEAVPDDIALFTIGFASEARSTDGAGAILFCHFMAIR